MADTAIIQCRNMINLFAGRGHLVMAEGTVADNTRMVEHRLHKSGRTGVAERTILGGQHVVTGLACADQTIVTRCAVIDDACMIKHASGKGAGSMTNTTILCGWQVVDGLTARAYDAPIIVTGCTGLYVEVDAGVVENALKCKRQGVMTPTAIGGCDGMVKFRFTDDVGAIMAADAIAGDGAVVKEYRQKIIGDMTKTAVTIRR